MANHTDDCPDCGTDRRAWIHPCCPAEEQRVKAAADAWQAEQQERRELFARHGIAFRHAPNHTGAWEVRPELDSLVVFLKGLP